MIIKRCILYVTKHLISHYLGNNEYPHFTYEKTGLREGKQVAQDHKTSNEKILDLSPVLTYSIGSFSFICSFISERLGSPESWLFFLAEDLQENISTV